MKKSKFFAAATAACLLFSFAACSGNSNDGNEKPNGEETHTHSFGETYQCDESGHWQLCQTCGKSGEKSVHIYSDGRNVCSVCGYTENDSEPAALKSASECFQGVKFSYAKSGYTNERGETKTFEELLDRQISILTQDIFFRLVYVYGSYARGNAATLSLKDGEQNYAFGGNAAEVSSETLLAEKQTDTEVTNADIGDIKEYQKSIQNSGSDNFFDDNTCLKFCGAINGGYYKIRQAGIVPTLIETPVAEKAWQWGKGLTEASYEAFFSASNVQKMKMAIAQILCGKTADGVYSEASYQKLLAEIPYTGYEFFEAEKLVEFIENTVIGKALTEKDNEYSEIINTKYGGKINVESIGTMNADESYTPTDSPRLYKGYRVVVTAIVRRALENVFAGSETSLYPTLNKNATVYTQNFAASERKAYTEFVLAPKADVSGTKLAIAFFGDAGKEISVKAEYVNRGETKGTETKRVQLTGEECEVTFDIAAATNGLIFDAYNGIMQSDLNTALFGGGNIRAWKNGDTYLRFTIENSQNVPFGVQIKGMYRQ
ncbi:MAG: hypothetical protein ACLTKZ_03570 [Lachnospiraceae bacterium]